MNLPQASSTTAQGLDNEAVEWFVRRNGGGFNASDEAAFQAWLQADAAHRRAYARQQAEWAALDRLPASGLEILRANLADDLAGEPTTAAAKPPRSAATQVARPARRRFLVPAFSAAALVVVAASAGFMTWRHWQAQPVFAQSFSTQRGQQLDVPLADGSRLRLDTATRVDVSYYRQRREVRLAQGQAVFSVQADTERPFEVLAGPVRVTVVGTRFSVRHTPGMAGDDGVRVAVEEGRVKVAPMATTDVDGVVVAPVFLTAHQQITSDARGVLAAVAPLSSAGIAPWRDNRVSFDNIRLDQVLAELQRYGETRLVVHDPAVASMRITGTFNPTRADSFARVLPQVAPVRLREADGVMEIVRAP